MRQARPHATPSITPVVMTPQAGAATGSSPWEQGRADGLGAPPPPPPPPPQQLHQQWPQQLLEQRPMSPLVLGASMIDYHAGAPALPGPPTAPTAAVDVMAAPDSPMLGHVERLRSMMTRLSDQGRGVSERMNALQREHGNVFALASDSDSGAGRPTRRHQHRHHRRAVSPSKVSLVSDQSQSQDQIRSLQLALAQAQAQVRTLRTDAKGARRLWAENEQLRASNSKLAGEISKYRHAAMTGEGVTARLYAQVQVAEQQCAQQTRACEELYDRLEQSVPRTELVQAQQTLSERDAALHEAELKIMDLEDALQQREQDQRVDRTGSDVSNKDSMQAPDQQAGTEQRIDAAAVAEVASASAAAEIKALSEQVKTAQAEARNSNEQVQRMRQEIERKDAAYARLEARMKQVTESQAKFDETRKIELQQRRAEESELRAQLLTRCNDVKAMQVELDTQRALTQAMQTRAADETGRRAEAMLTLGRLDQEWRDIASHLRDCVHVLVTTTEDALRKISGSIVTADERTIYYALKELVTSVREVSLGFDAQQQRAADLAAWLREMEDVHALVGPAPPAPSTRHAHSAASAAALSAGMSMSGPESQAGAFDTASVARVLAPRASAPSSSASTAWPFSELSAPSSAMPSTQVTSSRRLSAHAIGRLGANRRTSAPLRALLEQQQQQQLQLQQQQQPQAAAGDTSSQVSAVVAAALARATTELQEGTPPDPGDVRSRIDSRASTLPAGRIIASAQRDVDTADIPPPIYQQTLAPGEQGMSPRRRAISQGAGTQTQARADPAAAQDAARARASSWTPASPRQAQQQQQPALHIKTALAALDGTMPPVVPDLRLRRPTEDSRGLAARSTALRLPSARSSVSIASATDDEADASALPPPTLPAAAPAAEAPTTSPPPRPRGSSGGGGGDGKPARSPVLPARSHAAAAPPAQAAAAAPPPQRAGSAGEAAAATSTASKSETPRVTSSMTPAASAGHADFSEYDIYAGSEDDDDDDGDGDISDGSNASSHGLSDRAGARQSRASMSGVSTIGVGGGGGGSGMSRSPSLNLAGLARGSRWGTVKTKLLRKDTKGAGDSIWGGKTDGGGADMASRTPRGGDVTFRSVAGADDDMRSMGSTRRRGTWKVFHRAP